MDKTHVWVQTSLLSKALGPVDGDESSSSALDASASSIGSPTPKKSLVHKSSSAGEYERTGGDWSWSKCVILSGDAFASSASAGELKIKVQDEYSDYDTKEATILLALIKTPSSTSNSSAPEVNVVHHFFF